MVIAVDHVDSHGPAGGTKCTGMACRHHCAESAVSVIRGIALSEGIVIHAEALGKYKFILQAFAVVGLLVHYTYWGVNFFRRGNLFCRSAVIAVWSGISYSYPVFPIAAGEGNPRSCLKLTTLVGCCS